MADLTITDANVKVESGDDRIGQGLSYGEAVTALQPVCKNTAGALVKADATDSSLLAVEGLSLRAGDSGKPALLVKTGMKINVGAILTKRQSYVLSPNAAGGIAPITDLGAGDYLVYLGYAESTSILVVQIFNSGVTD